MGLVCTAFAHTVWAEGTRRVRVEHVTHPGTWSRSAPPCTLTSWWGNGRAAGPWPGGALIIAAGVLVILYGAAEGETSVAELAEAEPI